ncbi:hypothetical protein RK21_05157 [Pseudomonas plecoglossicida]|nr:hypothetical protein RK21_05157 [Pseudomonas plecoglossicida]
MGDLKPSRHEASCEQPPWTAKITQNPGYHTRSPSYSATAED